MTNSFIRWLEGFCTQIETAECPETDNEYARGFAAGVFETQAGIARKLRYAIAVETFEHPEYPNSDHKITHRIRFADGAEIEFAGETTCQTPVWGLYDNIEYWP